jgi:D-sedoheptulose 7-phosphate isomerase
MTTSDAALAVLTGVLGEAFTRRDEAGRALLAESDALAQAAQAMASRFHAGGRLLTFGAGMAAADAQHVAVEFLHPVIVGTPALPAIALTNDVCLTTAAKAPGEIFVDALRTQGTAADIALGLSADGRCPGVVRGLQVAGELGMLTLSLSGGEPDGPASQLAQHPIVVRHTDALAVRETLVTAYHILWELTHCFLGRGEAALA